MLLKRIIPCLDVDKGRVVKGVKYIDHVDCGDPVQVAQAYEQLAASQAAIEAAQLAVEAAEESLRVRTEQYRAGATTVSELVQATDARVGAQLNMLNATLDARLAYTHLMRATASDGPYADLEE